MNRFPPGRAGQNNNNPPGKGGQSTPRAQVPALTIAGFSRRNNQQNVIVDLTTTTTNQGNPSQNVNYSQSMGERRVVKLTAEQERQQYRQWQDQQKILESARTKERQIELQKPKAKPSVPLKPHPFTFEQSMYYEERNRRRTQMVDAISLNIIHRIFGTATTKLNGQVVTFRPGPVDLTLEPELLDPSNPNAYNFWTTNVSSGLIKRLTGLVVRNLFREEASSSYLQLQAPKNAIHLAIMVRGDRHLWGYVSLLPTTDGLKFDLIYQLPVPLDPNDDGNEMKYQYAALNEAYVALINNMMSIDE